MAITISGENNNDRILASDGIIDQISGFVVVGVMTATSFTGDLTGDVTGNLTGNVTGNINNSTLLLQTGGTERIRITGNNEIGIAGANYGSAGQVLTSGGSGSAVSWSAIPSQVTISSNADNRIITGGSGTNLVGEANFIAHAPSSGVGYVELKHGGSSGDYGYYQIRSGSTLRGRLGSNYNVDAISLDTAGGSSTAMIFKTGSSQTERLRISSDGKIGMGDVSTSASNTCDPDGNQLLIRGASTFQTNKGHIMLTGDSSTVGQGPQIVFSESGSGANWAGAYIGHVRQGGGSLGDLVFGTRGVTGDANTVPTERLRITSTGRLKINHTQTTNKLDDTWLSIYDANSDSSAIDPAGISKNYAMISLHNYGTGIPGDSTGIGFGAGASFGYTKGSIAFARSGSYGTGDLVFLTNNDQDATMVNDTDEKMRITRDDKVKITGVIETGPKTITGGTSLAIQNVAVKGVWSGASSVGKSIELISGYDSSVKMAAIGYNLTDTSTGSTYGGDLTFHTQPLYSSPQTPIPESMRISSSGYVTKPRHPSFCARHQGSDGFSGDIIVLTRINNSWDVWNIGGHYSTSTGKFTAPVAGIYYFEGQVMSTGHSNGDNIQDMLSLESNRGRISYCRQRESYFSSATNANGYYTNSVGGSVQLAVGDEVWIQRHSSQNWSYSNRYYSYFTGWLIG